MDDRYHITKNGYSMKYMRGYHLRDDEGNYYELCGTGMIIPGMGDCVSVWTIDNKYKLMRPSELEYVGDREFLSILVSVVCIVCVVWMFVL